MAEQPKDPIYDAMLERAKVHVVLAFDAFKEDSAIPWDRMHGNVPKVRYQIWVDALKESLKHYEQLERLTS
jgi:hypothetical protein